MLDSLIVGCCAVLVGLVLLSLLLCICLGCIFWGGYLLLCVHVEVWQFVGCSWCVGCELGKVCVFSLGV